MRTFLDWAPLVIGIFYFVALYFVWQNRASEKVITTAFIGVVASLAHLPWSLYSELSGRLKLLSRQLF